MLMELRERHQGKFTFLVADGYQLKDQVRARGRAWPARSRCMCSIFGCTKTGAK